MFVYVRQRTTPLVARYFYIGAYDPADSCGICDVFRCCQPEEGGVFSALDREAQKHPPTCSVRGLGCLLRVSVSGFDAGGEGEGVRGPQKPEFARIIRNCAPMVGCHSGVSSGDGSCLIWAPMPTFKNTPSVHGQRVGVGSALVLQHDQSEGHF